MSASATGTPTKVPVPAIDDSRGRVADDAGPRSPGLTGGPGERADVGGGTRTPRDPVGDGGTRAGCFPSGVLPERGAFRAVPTDGPVGGVRRLTDMDGLGLGGTCEVVRAEVRGSTVDAAELAALVVGPDRGAVVTFDGIVRDHDSPGRGAVTLLDYEGHPAADAVMAEVVASVAATSGAAAVAVVHRTGPLRVGDCALAVAVAAAHRQDAFATAARLVDQVKERLPVWKHQYFADGSDEWVGLGGLDAPGAPTPG